MSFSAVAVDELLQPLITVFAEDMFHSTGIVLRRLWIDAQLLQESLQIAMPVVNIGSDRHSFRGQRDLPFLPTSIRPRSFRMLIALDTLGLE